MERLTILSVLLVSLTVCAANAEPPYAREADAFLAARDPKVQPAQIAAICRATDGETTDLVRQSWQMRRLK